MSGITPAFDQRKRIAFLWLLFPLLATAILFSQTIWAEETTVREIAEQTGGLLLVVCLVGRCWCSLYIGDKKNAELVTEGPYRHTRNPLYFFSALGMAGLGMMLGSLMLSAVLFFLTYFLFRYVARREAEFLGARFGSAFREYSTAVPEFFPSLRPAELSHRQPDSITFSQTALRRTFIDSVCFLLVLPGTQLVEYVHANELLKPVVYVY